jgi:hypothetical protein
MQRLPGDGVSMPCAAQHPPPWCRHHLISHHWQTASCAKGEACPFTHALAEPPPPEANEKAGKKGGKSDSWSQDSNKEIARTNALFEDFYRQQVPHHCNLLLLQSLRPQVPHHCNPLLLQSLRPQDLTAAFHCYCNH